ncbi:hypothetical protein GDO81_013817 [Engystomops pustulosus]|uniref:Uncharacterized protein n=1 Tax=Engystomops pustulosus TaxID=76066 RepID=A0AAV7B5T7_ENGPU|nr:hypothetical protein GDO81_013817 [Engystomops pustulosus]
MNSSTYYISIEYVKDTTQVWVLLLSQKWGAADPIHTDGQNTEMYVHAWSLFFDFSFGLAAHRTSSDPCFRDGPEASAPVMYL